jgi:hypothetical protein
MGDDFMSAFSAHPDVARILGDLLLNDPRATVRQTTAVLIREKTGTVAEGERYERRGWFPLICVHSNVFFQTRCKGARGSCKVQRLLLAPDFAARQASDCEHH